MNSKHLVIFLYCSMFNAFENICFPFEDTGKEHRLFYRQRTVRVGIHFNHKRAEDQRKQNLSSQNYMVPSAFGGSSATLLTATLTSEQGLNRYRT